MPLTPLLVPLCLLCAAAFNAPPPAVPAIASVLLTKTNLAGGNSLSVKVDLTELAPLGGSAVAITYSTESVLSNPPKGIMIPAGQISASFTLATSPTVTAVPVNVTGSLGRSSASATVTVRPPEVQLATLPGSVQGGTKVDLSVTLDGPAPPGGSLLHLSFAPNIVGLAPSSFSVDIAGTSSLFGCQITQLLNGGCTQTLATTDSTNLLLVPASATQKTISLIFPAVRDDRTVTGAVLLGNTKSLSTTIRRPRPSTAAFVSSCSITAATLPTVVGPAALQVRVITSDRVSKNGAYVNLSSGSSTVVPPPTVELDQGGNGTANYACVPVALPAVTQSTNLSIAAAGSGVTKTASITNVPLTVSNLVLSKDSVSSGTTVTATITVSGVVGSDATVQLSSSNTAVVALPPSATVLQGASDARVSFVARVPLNSVLPQVKVVISATSLGSTRADTLIVAR